MSPAQVQTQAVQPKNLLGKIAIVTGGSRGIGAAIASRLAAEGATVVITYAKSKSSADKVVADIAAAGGKAVAVQANASSAADNKALVAQVTKHGKIDILVNNAGVFEGGSIEAVSIDQFERVFDTNLRGVAVTTMAALPHMNDGGRIINISSVAARAIAPGFGFYSATKAALDALTRAWAQDLGKRCITVNSVSPGTTLTEMLEAGLPEEAKQAYIQKTALGRLGEPNDIAAVVAFLAGNDGRWMNGKVMEADGGLAV
ncbi:MAG: glucose 1-dehydrogenase [Candidatus Melainabacteria bacterium]|nr:glucose 1-dehydrogenase [Candidatus Melainabacteria bacterium]